MIHQTEKTIRFDYVLGPKKTAVTYLPDGSSQHISMLDFHHEKLARAYWSKHGLVIEESVVAHWPGIGDFEDVQMTTTRWSLSGDAKTLTAKNPEKATTAVFNLEQQ